MPSAATPALPAVLRPTASLALVLFAVLGWRILPFPGAVLIALGAVTVSWRTGSWLHGDRRWLALFAMLPALVAALETLAQRHPAIWPCDVACAGGGAYASIGPVPLTLAATLAWSLLVLMVAATRWAPPQLEHQRSAPTPRYLELLAWILIGSGLFLISIAWRLRMPCHACGAYHTAALAVAGPLRAGRLRLGPRVLALALGMLVMMAVFGLELRRDNGVAMGPPPHPGQTRSLPDWARSADAGRRWGLATAPLELVLGLDLLCPVCAQEAPAWQQALSNPLQHGQVRLEVRLLARPSEAAGATLDGWFLAGAQAGQDFTTLGALLGNRSDATAEDALHGPASEVLDLPALAQAAENHRGEVELLLVEDAHRLDALGYQGRTPFAALLRSDGKLVRRWSGSLGGPELAAAITAALAPGPGAGGPP